MLIMSTARRRNRTMVVVSVKRLCSISFVDQRNRTILGTPSTALCRSFTKNMTSLLFLYANSKVSSLPAVANAAIFTLQNRCNTTIWPATLSGRGPLLLNGGTQLLSGESISFFVPNQWSGRFWPRTGCTFDSNTTTAPLKCLTGNCGDGLLECRGTGGVPPATIAEFTLDDVNFYDVSVVDGFNIPISIYPSGGAGNCKKIECFTDLNKRCPKELQVLDGGGRVVACKSACTAYNSPLYCCTEEYGSPEICKPSNFSKIFKDACLSYYSYAFDDATSTFTCGGDPDYLIRFC